MGRGLYHEKYFRSKSSAQHYNTRVFKKVNILWKKLRKKLNKIEYEYSTMDLLEKHSKYLISVRPWTYLENIPSTLQSTLKITWVLYECPTMDVLGNHPKYLSIY